MSHTCSTSARSLWTMNIWCCSCRRPLRSTAPDEHTLRSDTLGKWRQHLWWRPIEAENPERHQGAREDTVGFTSQRCHEHDDEGWHAH
jgi:hypothetical protein